MKLSTRQGEIMRLVIRGETDKGIAGALGISENTVGAHMRVIFKKVGARNRAQAAMKCFWMKLPNSRPSYIYFLFCKEIKRIKIGVSDSPEVRIRRHTTSCPFPVELLGVVKGPASMERNIHKRFEHLRRHLEWFEAAPELVRFISSLTTTKK